MSRVKTREAAFLLEMLNVSTVSHVETVCGSDASVPEAGILDGPLLRAEIDIGEAVALGVSVGPFEIVDEAPGMIGADAGSVVDGAGELGEDLLLEADAALVYVLFRFEKNTWRRGVEFIRASG